jgi:hypothetical protein
MFSSLPWPSCCTSHPNTLIKLAERTEENSMNRFLFVLQPKTWKVSVNNASILALSNVSSLYQSMKCLQWFSFSFQSIIFVSKYEVFTMIFLRFPKYHLCIKVWSVYNDFPSLAKVSSLYQSMKCLQWFSFAFQSIIFVSKYEVFTMIFLRFPKYHLCIKVWSVYNDFPSLSREMCYVNQSNSHSVVLFGKK